MIVAVDCDSTLFEEQWPNVGEIYQKAIEVVNSWHDRGHTIIINTCREDSYLIDAMRALGKAGLKYDYVNANMPERITQFGWDSRKIGCDVQIDDRDIWFKVHGVDWDYIEQMFFTLENS